MTVMYYEEDADLRVLENQAIGVLGYGGLGRSIALNLRDSGLQVRLGLLPGESRAVAEADSWTTIQTIDEVVRQTQIIMPLIPDELMPEIYLDQISPNLKRGHSLIFASGYTVAFGFIEPPSFVDVGLIAPRTLSASVRERYLNGEGFYSFVAAGQDASGNIWQTILALAKAIGSLRAGAVEITMEQEAELDLFMQQAILPAFHRIMTTAARLLLETGYPPEAAMLDLYISGELNDYMASAAEAGLMHALRLSTLTGQFGIFSRLERFNELKLERLMEITLDEIRNGTFAREWAREYADGYPRLRKLLKQQEQLELWDMEQQTIELLQGY